RRFAWENPPEAGNERHLAALSFARVERVESSRIRCDKPDGVLDLLAVEFHPGDDPAGHIILTFCGGGAIRLSVECVEAQLSDLGAVWPARAKPEHDVAALSPEPEAG